jgi:hypothetical protein
MREAARMIGNPKPVMGKKKPVLGPWKPLVPSDTWRKELHIAVQALLKPLFEHARRSARVRKRAFTVEYTRRYPKKGARGRPREQIAVNDSAIFGEFMPLLDRMVLRKLIEPDSAPRGGFLVRIEVMDGWERWVVYVRE